MYVKYWKSEWKLNYNVYKLSKSLIIMYSLKVTKYVIELGMDKDDTHDVWTLHEIGSHMNIISLAYTICY